MAKASTRTVVGNREDLTDVLTLLEPEMTPLTSMARKKKASGAFVEWQVDALAEPSFDGVDEGKDVDSFDNKGANRARLGNYIQKDRRTFAVSDIQELVDTAGVKSEFARAQALAARELKRDVEASISSSQDRQQQGGAGTPYKTRGMFRWLGFDGSAGDNFPSDIPTDQQVMTNTLGDYGAGLTEANLNGVLQELYTNNGSPSGNYSLIASPATRRAVSEFSRATTEATYRVTQAADSKKFTLSVTLYDGDFGIVNILPASLFLDRTSGSAAIPADRALIVDPGSYSLALLKAESKSELEDQGGGRRGYCDIIYSLCVEAPKAHGFLYT